MDEPVPIPVLHSRWRRSWPLPPRSCLENPPQCLMLRTVVSAWGDPVVALGLGPVTTVTLVFAGVGGCPLCPPAMEPWDSSLGVTNFPRKAAKKQPRVARTATCVLERRGCHGAPEYLIVQRPSSGNGAGQDAAPSRLHEGQSSLGAGCDETQVSPDVPLASSCPRCVPSPGLLAGLWEFPSLPLDQDLQEEKQREALADHLRAWTGWPVVAGGLRFVGEVSLEQRYAV